jgi:putative two-component system response regulator
VSSTVLIADDDIQTRGAFGGWLEGAGYDCVPSGTGDALATVRRQPADAAVVGVSHADDGGMWIVRRLRTQPHPVGVVVVATPPSMDVATTAIRLGVVDCLPGPPTSGDLLDAVRRAVLWRDAVRRAQADDRRVHEAAALGRIRLADVVRHVHPGSVQSLLLEALAAHAADVHAHAHRVAGLAAALADAMKLPPAEAQRVQTAALLHEIGRIALPDRLASGGGPLADDDIAWLRTHVSIAQDTLASVPPMREIAAIVGAVHERFDGSGYPSGLSGAAIPLPARIVAVADAYDALVSARCYRDPISHDGANAELVRLAGASFDPDVVHVWIRLDRPRR